MRKETLEVGIGVVPKKGETIYTNVFNLKQKKEFEVRKDVIYPIYCETCKLHYIGKTGNISVTGGADIREM